MVSGKRRTAREMAIQMLYQSDLGGSNLPQIFNTFDLAEYIAQELHRDRPESPESPERPEDEVGEPAASIPPSPPFAPSALEPVPPARPAKVAPRQTLADRAEYAKRRRRVEDAFLYAQTLVRGTVEHRQQIDDLIRSQADNWRLERMPAVDRNILRLAVYEMLFEMDIPKLVVVDEAIELAKKFGSEQSGRFVNGLLDGLLKQHTFPGSLT
ncbi:MAG TPA: transcription antitermination factor NusB [Thermoanaerobaculia bacterium]|nr:transcription antitermination factor NusB [Thermoanaerobaculia bacterium]